MIEELFTNLHRPGQYLGNEWNAAKNDFDGASVKFALGFPDLYEVGMSNLGIQILYDILNKDKESKITKYFLREMCKQGKVHCIRLGNKILLNIDDLEYKLSNNMSI